MRKLHFLLLAFIFGTAISVQSQSIMVNGFIMDQDGAPVPNLNVDLFAWGVDSSTYELETVTDDQGTFIFDLVVSNTANFGSGYVAFDDCNGILTTGNFDWTPNFGPVTFSFIYCENMNPGDTCAVWIEHIPTGGPLETLMANAYGTEPISYLWSTGESAQTITTQEDGTFCVTATDAAGCVAVDCYELFSTDTTCYTNILITQADPANSSWILEAYGYGVEPIEYTWNNGLSGPIITVTEEGTYCVTSFDANGCTYTACVEVEDLNSFCYVEMYEVDLPNGTAIVAEATSDNPGEEFDYLWFDGTEGNTIIPNGPGEYCVVATSASGCAVTSCYYYNLGGNDSCYVSIEVIHIAGSSLYELIAYVNAFDTFTYNWSNGEVGQSIIVSEPGLYCVDVFGQNCSGSACVTIDPIGGGDSCSVSIICDIAGGLTAYANGAAPFTYNWNTGESTQTIYPNNPNESYCVTITDANGCVADACSTIVIDSACQITMTYLYDSMNIPIGILAVAYNPINPNLDFTYVWDDGTVGDVYYPQDSGYYCVTAENLGNCVVTGCMVWPPQNGSGNCIVDIEMEINADSSATLTAYSTPNANVTSYIWTTGDSTQSTIVTEPGTYCVEVTIGGFCVATACIEVDFGTIAGQNSINGYILDANNPNGSSSFQEANVYLYQLNFDDSLFYLINTQLVQSTASEPLFYHFDSLPASIYLVQAELTENDPQSGAYAPTYHFSALNWQDAEAIIVPSVLAITKDIWMMSTTNSNIGPGIIQGSVSGGDGISIEEDRSGEGSEGVLILLYNDNDECIAYARTQKDGSFNFNSLPFGTYKVYVEIAGHDPSYQMVTISAQNPSVDGINFTVYPDGSVVSSIKSVILTLENVRIQPNPVSDLLHIQFGQLLTYPAIEVFDLNGKKIYSEKINANTDDSKLRTDWLGDGYYILKIQSKEGIAHQRFLKH